MALFTINEAKCLRDGVCANVCPGGLITAGRTEFPSPIPNAEDACIHCWHCVMCCPTEAFEHQAMAQSSSITISSEPPSSLEQLERLYISRKSTRSFLVKSVSRDIVTRLVELSQLGPSSHNQRCLEWIIIDDRSTIEILATATFELLQNRFDERVYDSSPHWSVFVKSWIDQWKSGTDVILRGAPMVLICHTAGDDASKLVDGSIAMTYIELAATAMGLSTCWVGFFARAVNTHKPVTDTVGLPDGHRAIGALVLGYPKHKKARQTPNKTLRVRWI